MLQISMMGLPLIKKVVENIYQRPMYNTKNISQEAKVELQNILSYERAAYTNSSIIEEQITNWMKKSLDKVSNKRSMQLYIKDPEYQQRKTQIQKFNQILANKQESNIIEVSGIIQAFMKTSTVPEFKKSKLYQVWEQWHKSKMVLNIKQHVWIINKWKLQLIKEIHSIELQAIKAKKKVYIEKMKIGTKYILFAVTIQDMCSKTDSQGQNSYLANKASGLFFGKALRILSSTILHIAVW